MCVVGIGSITVVKQIIWNPTLSFLIFSGILLNDYILTQADLRAGRSGLAPLPSPLWQPPNQLLQPTAASHLSAGAIPNTSLWELVTQGDLPLWGRPQRDRGTLPPTRKIRTPPWNPTLSISHFGRTGRDWAWTLPPEAKRTQLPRICRRRETQNQTSQKV